MEKKAGLFYDSDGNFSLGRVVTGVLVLVSIALLFTSLFMREPVLQADGSVVMQRANSVMEVITLFTTVMGFALMFKQGGKHAENMETKIKALEAIKKKE